MVHIKRQPVTKSILELVRDMDSYKIGLPDFQREFVWKPTQSAKLIESVIRQYPIGTLMFLNAIDNTKIIGRSFDGPMPQSASPKYYVIDGQQRLMTFYSLLRRPGKFYPFDPIENGGKNYKVFFRINQNLEKLPEDIEKNNFIVVEHTEIEQKEDYKRQGKNRLIPIEFVLQEDYTNEWFKRAFNKKIGKINEYKKNVSNLRKLLKEYDCFIEVINDELSPEDHYKIFQLLNEEGTDLTLFDLSVAKLSPIGVRLRKLWKDSQKDYPELKEYYIDPIYVLKVISLIRGTLNEETSLNKRPSCSMADLKKLYMQYQEKGGARTFEEDWEDACKYLQKAINKIRYSYGVYSKKYISYSPMIITLAAIQWWFEKYKRYNQQYKDTMYRKVNNWYFGSILNQEYDSKTDNVISEHYYALRNWVGPQSNRNIPAAINFNLSKKDIREAIEDIDSSADARYKLIICLPLMNSGEDIFSKEFLFDKNLHDHHIFPVQFLIDKGFSDSESINKIANRMLITDKTNQEIKKKNPEEYMKIVPPKNLKKHFISRSIIMSDSKINNKFHLFCEDRKKQIVEYLCDKANQ